MDSPFVSVIVPALNAERTIGRCLTSLLRLQFPAERREILVVDNHSTDRTAEIVRRFPVRRLWEPHRGAARARNCGIQASQGEILAFVDADCAATTGWLGELVAGFDSRDVGVVVGEVMAFPPGSAAERYTARRRPLIQRHALGYPGLPWFSLANVAVRREVFRTVGLLDPRFRGAEDIDLSWRFFATGGFALRYRPRAVTFHHNHSTAWGLLRRHLRYGYGHGVLHQKYPGRRLWNWRHELRAHQDLFRAAIVLGRTAIRSVLVGPRPVEALRQQQLDLVRKLGDRIGFVGAALRRRVGPG